MKPPVPQPTKQMGTAGFEPATLAITGIRAEKTAFLPLRERCGDSRDQASGPRRASVNLARRYPRLEAEAMRNTISAA